MSLDGVGSGRFGKPAGRLAKVEAAGAVTCAIQVANFQKGFAAGSQGSSSATMTWLLVNTHTTDHHAPPLFQPRTLRLCLIFFMYIQPTRLHNPRRCP